jgi:pimeloyl-ACP methyl ester carboxylesterase
VSAQVLLLPGLLCDQRVWQPQREALEADRNTVWVPRYGRFESIAEVARGLLSDSPARFVLAGHSLGGVVAFEILRQAPERVTHLVLLDTSPAPADTKREKKRVEQAQRALAGSLRHVVEQELLPSYLSGARADDASLKSLLIDMALAGGAGLFSAQVMALLERPDSRALLTEISCPSLVICGAEDRLCPPALHASMAAAIPQAELCIVPGAGHFPNLEQPDVVSAALLALLGG